MRNLIHLFNLICWLAIPNLIVAILSILFSFKYLDAVQSAPFIIVYFIYAITMIPVYCSHAVDNDDTMSFIK
jgi:hypothetical protein